MTPAVKVTSTMISQFSSRRKKRCVRDGCAGFAGEVGVEGLAGWSPGAFPGVCTVEVSVPGGLVEPEGLAGEESLGWDDLFMILLGDASPVRLGDRLSA